MPGQSDLVRAVRRFNRFYTQRIGVLQDGVLRSPFSLAQVRVLYELAHHDRLTASDLSRDLGMDAGYLSRILSGFEKRGFLSRAPSAIDGRQSFLSLTSAGRKAFAALDQRQDQEVAAILERLSEGDLARLMGALGTVENLLGGRDSSPVELRMHRAGDIGWVIHRHGVIYSQEFGYDETFEGLVAEIGGKFLQDHDPARERCWIAEQDGERLGSVFLVRASDDVAKLRLLLVEPSARGLGLGRRLVDECIAFARGAGYRKLTLWTQSELVSAGKIYQAAGFRLVHEEAQPNFGRDDLVAQTWDLHL